MIPRDVLKKIRQIEIRTNRLVQDALGGQYHSVFKGRGMNFDEVREYQPGDEVRSIDWNVTARMGTPFIKKYTEEREMTVMLLVDLSASGVFGSSDQSKRELSAELASVLAFSAIRNNDNVGLLLFTDQVEKFIPPKKGRLHVLRVIREVLYFSPQNRGTSISTALDYLNHVLSRRAVVFLISDFMDENLLKPLQITNKRHDVIAVSVSDARENELPNLGILVLEDSETGELVEINTSDPQIRTRFSESARRRRTETQKACRSAGLDLIEVQTGQPYLSAVRTFFERRRGRSSV